jgi:lipopolysaccharide biosynthesis glycosyltransferase
VEGDNQTTSTDRRIHVAAGCDANYALPLAAMLASIQSNLGPGRTVVAHVLDSGLDETARLKVAGSVDPSRIEVEWIPVEPRHLAAAAGTLRSFDTISLASYNRLLLPGLLPETLDRVLYLDCDLVVLHDLWDLWQSDLGGRSLGAVRELLERARYAGAPAGVRRYRELGLAPNLELFNAGVMLIDLRRWRSTLLTPRAFHYLREAGGDLRWHDQEALNVVAASDWLSLDIRWNITMHAYRGRSDPALREFVAHPRIVHYNASIKPWQPDFRLAQRDLFFSYLDRTAWAGWRPTQAGRAMTRRIVTRFRRMHRKLVHATTRTLERKLTTHSIRREMRRIVPTVSSVPARSRIAEIRAFVRMPADTVADPGLVGRLVAHGANRVILYAGGDNDSHLPLRRLLREHGEGHWCVLHDHDEWLEASQPALRSLAHLREYLERHGYDALECCRISAISETPPPGPLRRVKLTLSDPVSGRIFVSPVFAGPGDRVATEIDCRSRIAMLKIRRDLVIDRELRGVHAARVADIAALLHRLTPSA